MRRILIVGATSAIAEACARRWALKGEHLFLASCNAAQLQSIVDDLRVRGAPLVASCVFDADRLDQHAALMAAARASMGGLDTVLITNVSLPDQRRSLDIAHARPEIGINAPPVVALVALLATQFEQQGYGTIAVISSAADDRSLPSTHVSNRAKEGASALASSLRQRFEGKAVRVVTIEPGFVYAPLKAHLPESPPWTTPERVAGEIVRAIDRGRRRVLYTLGFWRLVMGVIRHVPESMFSRLKQ